MSIWAKDGKLVVNSDGKPINCDSCPCSTCPNADSPILDTIDESGSDDPGETTCESLVPHDGLKTITNSTGDTIDVYFYGSVNDDLLINGDIIEPNEYPVDPVCGTGCNGSHGWDSSSPVLVASSLADGDSFTVGVNNDCGSEWGVTGTFVYCISDGGAP